jgi:SAM-dependent methyltransferase
MSTSTFFTWFRAVWKQRRLERRRRRFLRSGLRPWTDGYFEYKCGEISRAFHSVAFRQPELPAGYGFRLDERIIEYPWLFSRLPAGPGFLLDAGSVFNFDFVLAHPALAGKKLHLCTLAPEPDCFWRQGISYLFEDLRRLPYRDGWFDWVVCLSTLEHVGMDNSLLYSKEAAPEGNRRDYLAAARELFRVLKTGGTAYFSFPFGKAANLGWYQVFDQAMLDDLIGVLQPASHAADYFRYHPEGWQRSTAAGTADATVFDVHSAKGYDPDFAAAARAVCCVELKK